jgi:hypothetical protein
MKSHRLPWTADFPVLRSFSVVGSPPVILFIALLTTAFTSAQDLPVKPPPGRYAGLWNNSPFTSRPVVVAPEPEPEVNPLEDYALIGIAPITGGHLVTLINRNNAEERVTIDSTRPEKNKDFKVIGINRKPGDPLGTTVTLSSGRVTGTIAFEQELLALSPPPAAPAQQPNANPQGAPGQPNNPNNPASTVRAPRPRVVASPTTSPGQAQGRPQAAPGRPQTGGSNRTDRGPRTRR